MLPGAGETLSRVKGLISKDQHGIAERERQGATRVCQGAENVSDQGATRVCQGALRKGSIGPLGAWPGTRSEVAAKLGKAGEAAGGDSASASGAHLNESWEALWISLCLGSWSKS